MSFTCCRNMISHRKSILRICVAWFRPPRWRHCQKAGQRHCHKCCSAWGRAVLLTECYIIAISPSTIKQPIQAGKSSGRPLLVNFSASKFQQRQWWAASHDETSPPPTHTRKLLLSCLAWCRKLCAWHSRLSESRGREPVAGGWYGGWYCQCRHFLSLSTIHLWTQRAAGLRLAVQHSRAHIHESTEPTADWQIELAGRCPIAMLNGSKCAVSAKEVPFGGLDYENNV